MRGRGRVFAAWVATTMPLAGCSFVVETSGLFGGTPEERDDGGTGEAAVDDARVDATAGDAGDASLDTRDSSAGCIDGPGRFCTGFDEPDPQSRWTSSYKSRGVLAFDGIGLSAPNALRAQLSAGAGNGAAYLIKDLPAGSTFVRCELDMFLESVPTTASTEIDILNVVTIVPGSESHNVYFASFDGKWNIAEYRGGTPPLVDRNVELGSLPSGRWLHVVLETTRSNATLTADGATVTLAGLTVPDGKRLAQVGISYASPGVGAASVLVDNVDCSFGAN